MDTRIRNSAALMATGVLALVVATPAALAGPAENAIEACKVAIAADQGAETMARLKKIKSRGNSYEAWFNLSDGDDQLKAYCLTRRNKVEEYVATEGRWTSRNPGRPESAQTS